MNVVTEIVEYLINVWNLDAFRYDQLVEMLLGVICFVPAKAKKAWYKPLRTNIY